MLTSRLTRILAIGVAAASLAGFAAANAQATYFYSRGMAPGACYLPSDVAFGGRPPSITVGSVTLTNTQVTRTIREWVFLVDYNTGARIRPTFAGSRTLSPGMSTTFPAMTFDLSFRTNSNFFWASAQVQIETYVNDTLESVTTMTPPSYRLWKNSGFYPRVDTGRYQSYC